jgi:hypothetical protein
LQLISFQNAKEGMVKYWLPVIGNIGSITDSVGLELFRMATMALKKMR